MFEIKYGENFGLIGIQGEVQRFEQIRTFAWKLALYYRSRSSPYIFLQVGI